MRSDGQRDVDLARAEVGGLRDLRMVMEDLLGRDMPGAGDDFPWPMLMHDGSRILHVNPSCLRWFECAGDSALIGRTIDALCSPEDRLALLAATGAEGDEPPELPHIQRFRSQRGATLIGRVLSRRRRFGDATATFTLIEPGSAERSFELLRLLGEAVDHLSDIVFITEAHSIDGIGRRIVFVNRAFTEASGFEALEVLGKTPNITIGEATDRATLTRLESALREMRPVREDLLKYRKDGSPYWVELQIIPVFDEAGAHSHWLSIQRDISERKRLEARLLESARLASAGVLSASLASELNSPLASVASSLEWLSDRVPALLQRLDDPAQPEVEEVLEALADARAGASRVATATSYLQLLGSPAPAKRQALRVDELLDAALEECERQLATRAQVERAYEAPLCVTADAARLAHALRLTVTNAVLAGSAHPELRLSVTSAFDRVHVIVEDNGAGIAPEMAGELGSPFGARKPRGIGDALALFVASRLVAELDGELALSPRPDGGTRVEIRLPRAP